MFKYNLIGDNDYIFDIVGTLSKNRGVDDLSEFLNLDKTCIGDWRIYKNIKEAVDIIINHIKNNSHIHIIVDMDCDGYTSAAIMYNYLLLHNENLTITYHIHDKKVHGIQGVEIPEGVDLVIIPDASSNEVDEHKRLKDLGLDIVIIDHHEVDNYSEDYATIVNPHIDGVGNLNLSGAGVVIKVCEALDNHFKTNYSNEFYDLVALGCIGDMMTMKDKEVRYYVNEGLDNINNSFFNSLINKQSYSMGGKLNPTTIGFYIAPLINSVTRIGEYEDRVDMFKAFIEHVELVKYKPRGGEETLIPFIDDMARRCVNIKGKQNRSRDKKISSILETLDIKDDSKVIIIKDSSIDGGTSGLIANNLTSKYMKPVIIFGTETDDSLKGSARSCKSFNKFKTVLLESGLFKLVAGHESAFGVELEKNKLNELEDKINELLKDETFEMVYDIDFLIPFKSVNKSIFKEITDLSSVWGQGLYEPKFVINDIDTSDIKINIMGKNEDTLSFIYNDVSFIAFRCNEELLHKVKNSKQFDIVGKASINEYKGSKSYQVIIEDFNTY